MTGLYPPTPTTRCELCNQFDAVGNLDWIGRAQRLQSGDWVRVVVFGHRPGLGCQVETGKHVDRTKP